MADTDWRPARREAKAVAGAIDLVVVALLGAVFAMLGFLIMLIQVNPLERDPTGGEWALGYAIWLLWIPAAAIYAALGDWTLGARMIGLRLERRRWDALALRGLLWWPSLIALGVGLWWSWVDREGRSPADIVSGAGMLERR